MATLDADTPLPYAWFDRRGRCARQGELALRALGQAYAQPACEAVLHPEDVIASSLQIPALPKARQAAAVRSVLEPMILGDMDDLAIGHGPRAADGSVALAWTPREPLRRAWALLGEHGLRVRADRAADAGTRGRRAAARTRRSALAGCRAILVAGHAAMGADPRLALASGVALDRDRLRDLAGRPEPVCHAVARRSPLIAEHRCANKCRRPTQAARGAGSARQARQELDALLARQGSSSAGDFLPLARATAQAMPFAADRVARLSYADHALTLTLADAGEQAQRVAETPALVQQAAALGLKLERGDKDATWRITPAQP